MQIRATALLPLGSITPINQLRVRDRFHVIEGRLVTDEVLEGAYLLDDIHRQRFVVYRNALHAVLDHLREFVIHDQLAEIEGDAHLKHPQAVNQVGPCQRCQQARERLFMANLGIGQLAVTLPAGDKAGQPIKASELCHCRVDHGAFRAADSGSGKTEVHCRSGTAVHNRRPFTGQLAEGHRGQ
jgi:hypothetical protein